MAWIIEVLPWFYHGFIGKIIKLNVETSPARHVHFLAGCVVETTSHAPDSETSASAGAEPTYGPESDWSDLTAAVGKIRLSLAGWDLYPQNRIVARPKRGTMISAPRYPKAPWFMVGISILTMVYKPTI